jgi:hypothetical protein
MLVFIMVVNFKIFHKQQNLRMLNLTGIPKVDIFKRSSDKKEYI